MKKNRKTGIGLFNSRNKWARRGRNLAHFLMSFIFYFFVYIFYGIAVVAKWLFSILFLRRNKPLTDKIAQKVKRSDTQIDVSLPDRFARLKVLMTQLENKPIQENLNIGNIIDLTDGYSETDLIMVIDRAAQIASSRRINNGASLICEQDLLMGVSEIKKAKIRG